MEHVRKKPQISILFFLFSFTNILALLYTAALPDLTKYFQITKEQSQQTISLFLLGYALGQLFYAPLSNALGRKPAIYVGGGLAIIGSLVCLLAIEINHFNFLLFGRLVTAFGSSCGLTLTYTLIADSFTHSESRKKLSYLISGFALFPALGIALGGFITEYFSWKGCFYFMVVYSFFVMGLCVFLPETIKEKHLKHLKLSKIAKSYFKQVRHLLFILCSLLMACASLFIYVFSAEAPFIAINKLSISADWFGLYNLIPYIGLFFGGFASAKLSHKISSIKFVLLGGLLFFIPSIIMLSFFEAGYINILTLFGIPLFIFFSAPIIISNCSAIALSVSEDKSYASALMNAIQVFIVFLSVASLRFFSPKDSSILPMVYSISGVLMILLWIVIKNLKVNKKDDNQPPQFLVD